MSTGMNAVEDERLDGPRLAAALDQLASMDADVRAAIDRIGYPIPRLRPQGFATLLRIMVSQQLSTRSAAAIWTRLEAACDSDVTAMRFAALSDDTCRAIGLSGPKTAYGRGLAAAVMEGRLDCASLGVLPEDEAIHTIIALKGFGRWSAEIYLLFAHGRRDSWPADDLALQIGMQRLKRLDSRPTRKIMDRIAESWRPWRGCGALFLWHYYGSTTLE